MTNIKTKTYIAAAPGTEVIYVAAYFNDDRDDDDPNDPEYHVHVERFPVALWQVGRDEFDDRVAKPILPEGMLTPDENQHGTIVCYPLKDGTVAVWQEPGITTIEGAKAKAIKGASIDWENEVGSRPTMPKHVPIPEETVVHDEACLYATSNGVGPCTCGAVPVP